MMKGDRFLKLVEEVGEVDVSGMASSNYAGHVAQDGARGFYCGGPDSIHTCDDCRCEDEKCPSNGFTFGRKIVPGLVSSEFRERLRSLGSEIPTHYKYTYNGSIPPVVLTHSTDPLFKVTLGLALMCGVIAGFLVGYLLVL